MTSRQLRRNKLRAEAERLGVKPSRYVAKEFDKAQVKKYGQPRRIINKAKGTHKRRTWKQRIAAVIGVYAT